MTVLRTMTRSKKLKSRKTVKSETSENSVSGSPTSKRDSLIALLKKKGWKEGDYHRAQGVVLAENRARKNKKK